MSKPLVAIVGRPNVGKSTLFNKIVGKRISIVEDTPGVTRDRVYAPAQWLDREFMLIDTGGIEPESDDALLKQMRTQAEVAIDHAEVILFVCDIRTGMTSTDQEVANLLRRSKKPIVLCLNKEDQIGSVSPELYEFYNLGLGEPFPVSSVHGHGTGDLLDEVITHFPLESEEEIEGEVIHVAIIGKPNVGKSSLINKILGKERMIVSDIAGTTRDAVDSYIENEHGKFNFIDTAGLRKRKKIYENIERYSAIRSLMAVDRADVCVIMIDATEGFTEQDSKIAGYAHEQGKGCIIVGNKWDLVPKDGKTMELERKKLQESFAFMSYAPILFISAETGQRLPKLYEMIRYVASQNAMRISTGMLNDVLGDATARVQPPSDKGKRLKIYYMTQIGTKPPTFVSFVNNKELYHFSYQRYIENQIREVFGLEGTPVKMIVRERSEKK